MGTRDRSDASRDEEEICYTSHGQSHQDDPQYQRRRDENGDSVDPERYR